MSNLRPANHSLVQQRVLLWGVGACGLYNCKIAKKKIDMEPETCGTPGFTPDHITSN